MTDKLDKMTEESLEELLAEAEKVLRELKGSDPACDFCGSADSIMARCNAKNLNICGDCLRSLLAKLDDTEKLLAMATESTARH